MYSIIYILNLYLIDLCHLLFIFLYACIKYQPFRSIYIIPSYDMFRAVSLLMINYKSQNRLFFFCILQSFLKQKIPNESSLDEI